MKTDVSCRMVLAAAWSVVCVGWAVIPSPAPNYWCTWATQGATLKENLRAGKIRLVAGEETQGQRDNLNERVLFDETGWAKVMYPDVRKELYLLADAGWDLPEGVSSRGAALALRGAFVPDAGRFPSLKGTPAERLKALNEKVKACGWRGLAVWTPAHVFGEGAGRTFSDEERRRVLTERMILCREAGVEYWKIDWGVHSYSSEFRRLVTEVRNEVYPGLCLEHCWLPGGPFSGIYFDKQTGEVSGPGRFIGNPVWEVKRREHAEVLAVSDVFRTYDVLAPFDHVTTLERCAYYSSLAEEQHLPVLLNIEDVPLIAMGLGHVLGVMRTDVRHGRQVTNDVAVALAWQKLAPPFGHDTGATTRLSEEVLEDAWTYSRTDCSYFTKAIGKRIVQKAPAIVTRGLPLPKVRAEGPKPFVCGVQYPNGAIALAFLPRVTEGERAKVCPAEVVLDVSLRAGYPLGLFGPFRSVTLTGGLPAGTRLWARNLLTGERRDVTAQCRVDEAGTLVIPGTVVEKFPPPVTPHVILVAMGGNR